MNCPSELWPLEIFHTYWHKTYLNVSVETSFWPSFSLSLTHTHFIFNRKCFSWLDDQFYSLEGLAVNTYWRSEKSDPSLKEQSVITEELKKKWGPDSEHHTQGSMARCLEYGPGGMTKCFAHHELGAGERWIHGSWTELRDTMQEKKRNPGDFSKFWWL